MQQIMKRLALTIIPVTFALDRQSFPIVPYTGNSSIHGQKFQYPALETLVSRLGNASVPPWERQFPA